MNVTHEGTFKSGVTRHFEFDYHSERPNEVQIVSDTWAYGDSDISVTVPLEELEAFLEKVRKAKA